MVCVLIRTDVPVQPLAASNQTNTSLQSAPGFVPATDSAEKRVNILLHPQSKTQRIGEPIDSQAPELIENSVFPNGKQLHSGSRATFKCYSKVNE
jgi:hypothetical protein